MNSAQKTITGRIERLINRYRNAVENRIDPRTMKSSEITDSNFCWRYRNEIAAAKVEAGGKLTPNLPEYRQGKIITRLRRKYDRALRPLDSFWVQLNSHETQAIIDDSGFRDIFSKSYRTATMRYDHTRGEMALKMTHEQFEKFRTARIIEHLRRRYSTLQREGHEGTHPDPNNFASDTWHQISLSDLEMYL